MKFQSCSSLLQNFVLSVSMWMGLTTTNKTGETDNIFFCLIKLLPVHERL